MDTYWKHVGTDYNTHTHHEWECDRCGFKINTVTEEGHNPKYCDPPKQPVAACIPCTSAAQKLSEAGLTWLDAVIERAITKAIDGLKVGR